MTILGKGPNAKPGKKSPYIYNGELVRVVDGDTFIVQVDLGFHCAMTQAFRLAKVDTPELRGPTRASGQAARIFVVEWFKSKNNLVSVKSYGPDKYGRWVADMIDRKTGESLHEVLLFEGFAKPYH